MPGVDCSSSAAAADPVSGTDPAARTDQVRHLPAPRADAIVAIIATLAPVRDDDLVERFLSLLRLTDQRARHPRTGRPGRAEEGTGLSAGLEAAPEDAVAAAVSASGRPDLAAAAIAALRQHGAEGCFCDNACASPCCGGPTRPVRACHRCVARLLADTVDPRGNPRHRCHPVDPETAVT